MPNEINNEEGLFVGYYERLYDPSNMETYLPYVDCHTKTNEVLDKNRDKIKKVIKNYLKKDIEYGNR